MRRERKADSTINFQNVHEVSFETGPHFGATRARVSQEACMYALSHTERSTARLDMSSHGKVASLQRPSSFNPGSILLWPWRVR